MLNTALIDSLYLQAHAAETAAAVRRWGCGTFPWVRLYGAKALAVCAAIGLEALERGETWTRISPRSRAVIVTSTTRKYRVTWRPDCLSLGVGICPELG